MRFEKTNDGYLDNDTGLIWKLEDEIRAYSHEEALKLNGNVWRMPTITELLGIVEYSRHDPATFLPNIRPSYYWSASIGAYGLASAGYVDFRKGYTGSGNRESSNYVRLVRDTGASNEI